MTPYEFDLDLTPGARRRAVVPCSQGDIGRPFVAHLMYAGTDYEIPTGSSIEIHALKPDGNIYEKPCTWKTHYAYFESELQLSPVAGDVNCELSITGDDNSPLGTANFTIHVEKSPIESGVASESEIGSEIGWVKEARAAAAASDISAKASAASAAEAKSAAELAFKRLYGLANMATDFTRNADGSIASSTATNSDESVTAVTTFTRSTDGSTSKIVTVVTQTAGSFKYTQTSIFARNTDGSIKTITDSYKKEDK